MQSNLTNKVLFPYYINQNRLLDIYASLCGGYEDYEEVIAQNTNNKSTAKKAAANTSLGFRIFKIGASIDHDVDQTSSSSEQRSSKRVQTPTSMLTRVIQMLENDGFINRIDNSSSGSFVITPVNMRINSIRGLIKEAERLTKLTEDMKSIDDNNSNKKTKVTSRSLSWLSKMVPIIGELFESEEIISESDNYALVGSINDNNLYQASRSDIVDSDLQCFAQVKRVFPNGAKLMRDTLFAKMKDHESKDKLLQELDKLATEGNYHFQCDVIPEITNKPVYQVEIVALYQWASNTTDKDN